MSLAEQLYALIGSTDNGGTEGEESILCTQVYSILHNYIVFCILLFKESIAINGLRVVIRFLENELFEWLPVYGSIIPAQSPLQLLIAAAQSELCFITLPMDFKVESANQMCVSNNSYSLSSYFHEIYDTVGVTMGTRLELIYIGGLRITYIIHK